MATGDTRHPNGDNTMDKQTSVALAELFLKGAEDTAIRAAATGNDELIKRANIALEIAKRDLIEALQIEE